MQTWILAEKILTPLETILDSVIIIEGGKIIRIEPKHNIHEIPSQVKVINAQGSIVTPGFIDIHVHGAVGVDAMDATPASLEKMSSYFVKQGVTSFFPTTGTQSTLAISAAIDNIKHTMQNVSGAQPLGVHLEGPYLSHQYRGAHGEEWLRNPDPLEYEAWFRTGIIKLMTIAPELAGTKELMEMGKAYGVVFTAGHTKASPQEIEAAIALGLRLSTHTFNGMAGLHHRDLGTVGALLASDDVYCEIIADGIHVHPEVIKMLIKIKGIERTVLVTDAIRATGMPDGTYDLLGHNIIVKAGIARTQEGGLAGSTLTLSRAISNVQKFSGISINQAVGMATLSPAKALGLEGKKGEIRIGNDADIVIFDNDLNIKNVLVKGIVAYEPL
ncbi:MAG TPA: N-acetylglucosamine-6-phosphate deacetylase [Anaerolineaceae bacterium]|nr:N-acetylglucosamine-6-phosphate deacetylase [Anaerolineaceae bacterium]